MRDPEALHTDGRWTVSMLADGSLQVSQDGEPRKQVRTWRGAFATIERLRAEAAQVRIESGDTVRHVSGRTGMALRYGTEGRVWVFWDDALSHPRSVAVADLVVTGHDPAMNHVVWDPRHPEHHGKRRTEVAA